MKDKYSISSIEKHRQITPEILDELNRAYLKRWHSMASFALGCMAGSAVTIFVVVLWFLLSLHHGR